MIVFMERHSISEQVDRVVAELGTFGVRTTACVQDGRVALIAERAPMPEIIERIQALRGVAEVLVIGGSSRLGSRAYRSADSTVRVGDVVIGGPEFVVAAGPCAVENGEQLADVAAAVALSGATMLRGGAFKPRSSPYSFQGLGPAGLELLAEQRVRTGLPVVTEVLEPAQVGPVAERADMLQIGARNMQNFPLLREVGRSGHPTLLKRGLAATVDEWLAAAEYVLREGNGNVVLCERGIRTFEPATRFTLDLSAVAVVKRQSHLPVIVDPSHGTGRSWLVRPLALAAAAAGADGLLVDVHTDAHNALCDADQALTAKEFDELMRSAGRVLGAVDRPLACSPALVEGM